jgi:hypothetical protein
MNRIRFDGLAMPLSPDAGHPNEIAQET